jgi:hypothetical protein
VPRPALKTAVKELTENWNAVGPVESNGTDVENGGDGNVAA